MPKKGIDSRVDPDEILLDAKNLPAFDRARFEGQLEQSIGKRAVFWLSAFFLSIFLIYLFKLSVLQLSQGEGFSRRSQDNSLEQTAIYPSRGLILDRGGQILAWNAPERRYFEAPGFGHLLGYLGLPDEGEIVSGVARDPGEPLGKEGVEEAYQEILSGDLGLKIREVDALGQLVSESVQVRPEAGEDLVLTIDARVQARLHQLIAALTRERGFSGGAGVIMEIASGDILALASVPEYSPNLLVAGRNTAAREVVEELISDPRSPFLNRAIAGLYAPGSIIKPIIAVGALSEDLIDPEKKILSTGSLRLPNPYQPGEFSIFLDWRAHGWVNLAQAIAVSSNVYFFTIAGGSPDVPEQVPLSIKRIASYAELFGLGKTTGIALAGEEIGTVPTPSWKATYFDGEPWRLGDTYNTAIGQFGFQVTALQMARAYAALGSGKLPRPRLALSDPIEAQDLLQSEEDLRPVREGLRLAVTSGTAQALSGLPLKLAAKTGTAQIDSAGRRVNSWVAGFWPLDNPRFSFAAVLEKGPAGNLVGAPIVMRDLLAWMAQETPEYLQ